MNTKFYKNEKFQIWFFSILYFLLAVSIVVTGCLTFKKLYYQPIVVDGTSMWPTLAGGKYTAAGYESRHHYGLADLHRSSVNEFKRFDVVVTYYPQSWGADGSAQEYLEKRTYKIKRVWGFPGETISLTYQDGKYTFTASKAGNPTYSITSSVLKEFKNEFEFNSITNQSDYKYVSLNFEVFEFALANKTFRVAYDTPSHHGHVIRTFNKTLADDEYFVMGDNWQGSTDCYEKSSVEKLSADYIQGRVICFNAYTTYQNKVTSNNHKIERMYEF